MKRKRKIKPGPDLPKLGHIEGHAIIVDLNLFSSMVSKAEETCDAIFHFTRDALAGAILEIEAQVGEAVAFMGDAISGFLLPGLGSLVSAIRHRKFNPQEIFTRKMD